MFESFSNLKPLKKVKKNPFVHKLDVDVYFLSIKRI